MRPIREWTQEQAETMSRMLAEIVAADTDITRKLPYMEHMAAMNRCGTTINKARRFLEELAGQPGAEAGE